MKVKIVSIVLAFVGISSADVPSPEDIEGMRAGHRRLSELVKIAPSLSNDEAIERLGVGLYKTQDDRIYKIEEREVVRLEIQKSLLSIPGHAKYYRDKIMGPYSLYKEGLLTRDPDKLSKGGRYSDELFYAMPVLVQLSSPETVGVLGEMLAEDYYYKESTDISHIYPPSVALVAENQLMELPLVDKPESDRYDLRGMLPGWQKWYAEIKSGERSFAFLGEKVSYRFKPDGSVVTEPRDPSDDQMPVKTIKATPLSPATPATAKNPTAKVSSETPWPRVGWIAGIILLIGGVIAYSRRKTVR